MSYAASNAPGFALFSGGHDSLCSTHLSMTDGSAQGVVHIHTGIGIPETRDFVHETCREHGWPLTELRPEAVYEDLVLERGGFPYGQMSHRSMYWFLKKKPLRAFMKTQTAKRVHFITGIRKAESTQRMNAGISVPERREGRQVWLSPILEWTAIDCGRYIEAQGLRRNEVSDTLHRSGECLCGALAQQREIIDIGIFYPEVAERIHSLERRCEDAGLAACVWAGSNARGIADEQESLFRKSDYLPLCSSCEAAAEE